MKQNMGVELRQIQKLNLTPQLKQSLEVLQLTTVELNEYIEQQVLENPVLEMVENEEPQYKSVKSSHRKGDPYGLVPYYDEMDLGRYLMLQMEMLKLEEPHLGIVRYMIQEIDEDGFLKQSAGEIARRFSVSKAIAKECLDILHGFDPPGIGAENISECLILQLSSLGGDTSLEKTILEEHMEDVAENRIKEISAATGCRTDQVQQAINRIRELNPRPGGRYKEYQHVEYVTPDVFIRKIEGVYEVSLNDNFLPRLCLDDYYIRMIRDKDQSEEVREYVREKAEKARWLIRAIEQRNQTLYRVSTYLVNRQIRFLEEGERALIPLTYREVGDELEIHESTVGRAISGKYVETPRGVFEFRYFFPSRLGDDMSSTAVKSHIIEFISKEEPEKPLSDQKLATMLGEIGITVSRRTIAKYRDELGIRCASKRRKY